MKVRVIRLVSPDGTVSALLTNIYDKKEFPRNEITDLCFRRHKIEEYCRDEKVVLEIERFHSRTVSGILQEFYAAMIMAVISGTPMILSSAALCLPAYEFQFKNAVMTLASEAFVPVPDDPEKAVGIFNEILSEISRVKYYSPKIPRSPQPRVSKRPVNKWCSNKLKKMA